MREMKVWRDDLIRKLKKNRERHRETFLAAQEEYRGKVIEELDRMFADAREGRKIVRKVSWPEPEDHTADYDQAIAMLEMSIEQEIDIDAGDFQRLVMDDWGWKARWMENTASYVQK